ncbi:hypothetical protein PCANC_02942 [Puccinia coronata f. sp. avenae]|uniref:Uncharacterized protein n=1 Tax=Puccinia coronata f. sp. avenae TaxID=200324 RepID=A0A2N5T8N2_9BASI|nr:hypothetical protein PCANC_02942 [Puccinia coronata f. sp. avenae]
MIKIYPLRASSRVLSRVPPSSRFFAIVPGTTILDVVQLLPVLYNDRTGRREPAIQKRKENKISVCQVLKLSLVLPMRHWIVKGNVPLLSKEEGCDARRSTSPRAQGLFRRLLVTFNFFPPKLTRKKL